MLALLNARSEFSLNSSLGGDKSAVLHMYRLPHIMKDGTRSDGTSDAYYTSRAGIAAHSTDLDKPVVSLSIV